MAGQIGRALVLASVFGYMVMSGYPVLLVTLRYLDKLLNTHSTACHAEALAKAFQAVFWWTRSS